MALSKSQEAMIAKVRATGGGELGVALDDEVCSYLVGVIASDLSLIGNFPEFAPEIPSFFGSKSLGELKLANVDFPAVVERLFGLRQDTDAYFSCLATLHKARVKYERILQSQPIPTIDQVGPRSLLQYGTLTPKALTGFLFWRKWIYDIDNRAAQETGYVFQPIIAHSIGGVTVSAAKSPVRRDGKGGGRQVDCIRASDKRAYEIKLRVTIAASGQGRWEEEMSFPNDCKASGYIPVLIVLDPTSNPKLIELYDAFHNAGGDALVGDAAWTHLTDLAGETMGLFLKKYVRDPIDSLLREAPQRLPDILLQMKDDEFVLTIGAEQLKIKRNPKQELASENNSTPADADEHIGGP